MDVNEERVLVGDPYPWRLLDQQHQLPASGFRRQQQPGLRRQRHRAPPCKDALLAFGFLPSYLLEGFELGDLG